MTEAEALLHYQSYSYELNQCLWSREELKGELKRLAETLDSAISCHVSVEPMTVYRGGTWRHGYLCPGMHVDFLRFTSATVHRDFTKQFMHSDCPPAARFTIHCPTGTPHAPIAAMDGLSNSEAEILLPRRSRFEVVSVLSTTIREEILDLVGPDPQRLHKEVWDVILALLL